MLRRWLSMLAVGGVLLHGVPACLSSGEDQLNPQPLPPGDPPPETHAPSRDGDNAGSSSGGAAPTGPGADAGLGFDANDDAGGDAADGADQ